MLVLREIESKEFNKVKVILEKENIEDDLTNGVIYILTDGNCIMGIGKLVFQNEYGILRYIVIKEEYRGFDFGDSMLRSLIFKAQSLGIKEIYHAHNEKYLLKKGFKDNKMRTMNDYKLHLNTDEFFQCKRCGDKDEI